MEAKKVVNSFDIYICFVRIHARKFPPIVMTDFLTQVQETEQQAAVLLEKATARKQNMLRKYRADLAEEQEKQEDETQEVMKVEVQTARAKARQNYETQVKTGEGDAISLEAERGAITAATLPDATKFFLELF